VLLAILLVPGFESFTAGAPDRTSRAALTALAEEL